MVLFTDGELLEIACDVVGGATVHVPVRVYTIIGSSRTCTPGIALALVAFIIAVPTISRFMTSLATDLAG
jgi:hypothetical protein